MKLIVWLGNPGKEYIKTRHNIWFIMIDEFCKLNNYWPWKIEKSFHAEIIKVWDLIFCKPQTYMNKSWEAIKKIIDYYKIIPEDILVIHDEIDLPTWKIQKKIGWSPAGHNGLKSILYYLENNNIFTKIRIWVDRPQEKEQVSDWVLGEFTSQELLIINNKNNTIIDHINMFIWK